MAGRINNVSVVGMPERPPVHEVVVRERSLGGSCGVIDVDLEQIVALAIAPVDDPLAVGREERAAVIALGLDDPTGVLAVRIHDVNIGVSIAKRGEDNLLAVG